jgi:hypothetical protein
MNLAILHYHLNRGGVTQVIVNHLRALNATLDQEPPCRVALVHSGRRADWPEQLCGQLDRLATSLCEVPDLDYEEGTTARPSHLARQLRAVFDRLGFSPEETIIHVHNHALGKNVSLPGALGTLARQGYGLLLQIHDFPEDFRPANYRRLLAALTPDAPLDLPSVLYPQAGQIHYAVLNRRDRDILLQAGVAKSHLHLLPNPVSDIGPLPSRRQARAKLAERLAIPLDCRFVLYPVRGIRRKNLGEALLWSALCGDDTKFGFTLAPLNPLEQPGYRAWKELAATLGLPCVFELGGPSGLGFTENLAAADLILTTSVAEGFGMVFLEACLAERPLVGRDLPEITSDFVAAGIRFDGLRPRLSIPVAWVGTETLHHTVESVYCRTLAAYDRPPPTKEKMRRDFDHLTQGGLTDFGLLSAELQQGVIRTVRAKADHRDRLHQLNPWIDDALSLDASTSSDMMKQNTAAVRQTYSLQVCGRRLQDAYRSVAASPRDEGLGPLTQGERILDAFLELPRFHPIRIET